MHTTQVNESSGNLSEPQPATRSCPKCGNKTVVVRTWESSCGGYEDCKYNCTSPGCNWEHWVDGIDS